MSIEAAIDRNTEALQALHALLSRMSLPAGAPAPDAATKPPKATKAKAEAPAPAPAPAATTEAPGNGDSGATTAPSSPTAEAGADAAPATSAPTYDDVKRAVLALVAKKGRPAAVDLFAKFGVASGPELKAEQYADVVDAATKATA